MKRLLFGLLAAGLLAVASPANAGRSAPHFDVLVNVDVGGLNQGWVAPYLRETVYAAATGWTDGDRVGYRCGYAFLLEAGVPVGRVTFTRVDAAASYAMINDRSMAEGVRYYDGRLADGSARQLNDCPAPSESYEPATVSERPTVVFANAAGAVLEIRDYKSTAVGAAVTFASVLVTDQRVTVVAYADGLPFMVMYYDSLLAGVTVSSDV